jgi:hypothetical protein
MPVGRWSKGLALRYGRHERRGHATAAGTLVRAGADVLSITETRRSLEDVYLELIDEDRETAPR